MSMSREKALHPGDLPSMQKAARQDLFVLKLNAAAPTSGTPFTGQVMVIGLLASRSIPAAISMSRQGALHPGDLPSMPLAAASDPSS